MLGEFTFGTTTYSNVEKDFDTLCNDFNDYIFLRMNSEIIIDIDHSTLPYTFSRDLFIANNYKESSDPKVMMLMYDESMSTQLE